MNGIVEKVASFSTGSRFSFGVVVTVVGLTGYITGGFFGNSKEILGVRYELKAVDARLGSIEAKLEDRWTKKEMANFADLLGAMNPTLRVPEVRKQ